jgi:hypothetical protein
MEITLELGPEMSDELLKAARDCRAASLRQFALDAIESCLASRRLPNVYVPALDPRCADAWDARACRRARRGRGTGWLPGPLA